jgi:3-(3-hydroxy-phenyl)propionate hydroxylase
MPGDAAPVLIVGAGPTGLTAATLLGAEGIACLLIERHAQPYPLPRAVHLDDEIRRVLQRLGVEAGFSQLTRAAPGMRLLDAQHRVMAELVRDREVGHHGYPQANLFDQPDLEALLRENLKRFPSVQTLVGTEVIALEQGSEIPARVRVTLRETASGREQVVAAQAVLGCDGANSFTRQAIGSQLLDLGYEERWLVVDARSQAQLDTYGGVDQVCDPARAATYMRVGPHRYRWEFRLVGAETEADLLAPGRLEALVKPWLGDVPFSALEVQRSATYTFRARLVDRWRKGRVFLLGDAAHLTPPFIGQGLCAGVRDAVNLSWKLARVLAGADERLLDTYEAERAPHAKKLVRLAVMVGWAMTGGQGAAAAFRKALLSVLMRVPGFGSAVVSQVAPPLPTGPLVRPGRLAGTQVPQPWVVAPQGRMRLDDVLGEGFVLLHADALDAGGQALAQRLGAKCLRVFAPGMTVGDEPGFSDVDGAVTAWLRRARARVALLRPDRVLLNAAARPEGLVDEAGGALLALPSAPSR